MIPDTAHKDWNCIVTNHQGQSQKVFSNWLHNNNLDHWQGWHCDAGTTRFYIDSNFNIWSGECKNQKLGNVLEEWKITDNPVCKRTSCTGCTDDLATKKYQIT